MIHSRETSPPTLIQPRPTGAAPPPHATRLHGVGSLREGLSTTTPQPSTPTRTSSGLYWRPGCHQSLASQHLASPDPNVRRRRVGETQIQKKKRGDLARPPPESRRQEPGQSTFRRHGILFHNSHSRPGCPRAQPPNDGIQQNVPRSSGSATPAPKEISHVS